LWEKKRAKSVSAEKVRRIQIVFILRKHEAAVSQYMHCT